MTKKKLIFVIIFVVLIVAGLGYFSYQYFRPTTNTLSHKYTFIGPVPAQYCDSGKIIKSQGQYVGIGYQLPAGTQMLATFTGQATSIAISLSDNIGGG